MSKKFFAHSGNNQDKSDWQPLADHLRQVGRLAAENASAFVADRLAEVCGLLHDVGKYSEAFARRLEGGKRVDHATAGAKIAVERWQQLGKLLAFVVAGHHAGLANGVDQGTNRTTLKARLDNVIPAPDDVWKTEITLPETLLFPFKPTESQAGFQIAFLVRMLFSRFALRRSPPPFAVP